LTLWIVLAGMTGLAVLCALWPLAFRANQSPAPASDVAFYKGQIGEIERDVERGQLPPGEAAAARAEAVRRLLAASAAETAASRPREALALRRAAAVLILIAVPLVALGLYARLGRPELPDEPLASRAPDLKTPEGVEAAIARIESHLVASPDDAKGWAVIAPVYMRLGRFSDAVNAYQQLLRLKGESAMLRASYGEALVGAANGLVTADARAAFDKALGEEPGLPAARFYRALAAEQDGDKTKAIDMYQALLKDAPKGAVWRQALSARLAALQNTAPAEQPGGATETNTQAVTSDPQQQQMIHGMVESLATRLAQSGGDASEWARLVRSYIVLHEPDKARDALASARKALAADPASAGQLDLLARELGLGG
jgi:cytochrome c-type biogenesis protein CcmH